jgi:hypothetical protein
LIHAQLVNPLSGVPLSVTGKLQSRDLSFVCQLAFVKDSKATYKDCLEEFLFTFNNTSLVVPATEADPKLSKFEVSSCQDLPSEWKTTQLGGVCHTANFFCPQCMVARTTMTSFKVTSERCNMCVQCYCHLVCDPVILEATRWSIKKYIDRTFDEDCKILHIIDGLEEIKANIQRRHHQQPSDTVPCGISANILNEWSE